MIEWISCGARPRCAWTVLTVVCLLFTACRRRTEEPVVRNVTVYAAASLQEALTEIGRKYEASHAGTKILFSFDASGSLAKKIDEGAPADVFVSASDEWMRYLVKQGKVPADQSKVLLNNRLVCVVPSDSELKLKGPGDLAGVNRIAIGDPAQVPAGEYAVEALKKLGLWDRMNQEKRFVLGSNVRVALAWVESKEAQAGIVYRSDAMATTKVRQVFEFPQETHSPITYLIGPVSKSATTRQFISFLESNAASGIFSRYGFIPAVAKKEE